MDPAKSAFVRSLQREGDFEGLLILAAPAGRSDGEGNKAGDEQPSNPVLIAQWILSAPARYSLVRGLGDPR